MENGAKIGVKLVKTGSKSTYIQTDRKLLTFRREVNLPTFNSHPTPMQTPAPSGICIGVGCEFNVGRFTSRLNVSSFLSA